MVVEAQGNAIPKEKVSQKSNTKPATFFFVGVRICFDHFG